jgi:hypothetical protein
MYECGFEGGREGHPRVFPNLTLGEPMSMGTSKHINELSSFHGNVRTFDNRRISSLGVESPHM